MEVKVTQLNDWRCALRMARYTVSKGDNGKDPSDKWRNTMLLAEHSPIREIRYLIEFSGIKTWVAQHLARHDFGGQHHAMDCAAVQYGATQRTDRTGVDRDELRQGELTNHAMTVNAQDLINMSRKRLCRAASAETRGAWEEVVSSMEGIDANMALAMVPECIYRGWCYDITKCGYDKTEKFKQRLNRYRGIE